MPRNSRVFCVANPARRNHDRAWQLVQHHCAALGSSPPTLLTTTIDDPGDRQTHEALQKGADLIIAHGGDGTIRNIGNVLAHTGIPLGIVPIGTANIFHLNVIGSERRLDQSVRTALMGIDTRIDMGRVRLETSGEQVYESRFLVVVGVGRDAISLEGVSNRLKRTIGPGAYFAAGLPQLARSPVPMKVKIDSETLPVATAWSVLVGNCGMIPGGITMLPEANLQDGKLNLLHVGPKSFLDWVPIAMRGLRGHSRPVRGLMEQLVSDVTIIPEEPVTVQIDGDVWTNVIKANITVDPSALVVRGRPPLSYEPAADSCGDPLAQSGMDTSSQ